MNAKFDGLFKNWASRNGKKGKPASLLCDAILARADDQIPQDRPNRFHRWQAALPILATVAAALLMFFWWKSQYVGDNKVSANPKPVSREHQLAKLRYVGGENGKGRIEIFAQSGPRTLNLNVGETLENYRILSITREYIELGGNPEGTVFIYNDSLFSHEGYTEKR